MYIGRNIGAASIIFYSMLATCTTGTQNDQPGSVKLTDAPNDNKIRSPVAVQLVKYDQKKTNVTTGKVQSKNNKNKTQKGATVSKGSFKEKSGANKKLNTTKDDKRTTKSILRMGNRQNEEKWPKKRPIRDKGSTSGLRSTKLNMMQIYEMTPLPTLPTMQKLSVQNDDKINELLSPYKIKEQLRRIGAKFKDVNVTAETVGRTLEYNDIVLLKFTQMHKKPGRFRADENKYIDDSHDKKIIFIVHGLSVVGMIFLDCLVKENRLIRLLSYYLEHLDKFDIFLIPMANPDGYAYKMPMWNKNVSPQDACPGVALDRNFDVAWNTTKQISSCSQQYPGPAPFSEPETRAIRDVLHRYSHKIIAYIHVHASTHNPGIFKGDAVLYPRGYTDVQSDDDKYIDLKGEIDEAMRKASFQVYSVTVDTLYNWYGKVSGASVDYASTVYGIPYAMEFVMQIYEEPLSVVTEIPSLEQTSYHAVVEVWKRVIDVTANNIWVSMHSNEA